MYVIEYQLRNVKRSQLQAFHLVDDADNCFNACKGNVECIAARRFEVTPTNFPVIDWIREHNDNEVMRTE